ncbi:MAG: hypothetical protein QOJ16_3637 [Acidobacteriota bacterium]|jgi:hypothetical protein|nr:hypothetical protein [Acidobacteriota bacterium]
MTRNFKAAAAWLTLCGALSLWLPSQATGNSSQPPATLAPTYDQCMAWCTQSNDFFTCDDYCSRYSDQA